MSFLTVGIIVAVLGIVLYGLWIAGQELTEFDDLFIYAACGFLLLIVGAAVYLSFAIPTFATDEVIPGSQITVRKETSNLLQEN